MTVSIQPPIVRVLEPRSYGSKREVIETIGETMVGALAVTAAYVDGMLRKEREANTIVTTEVALPHGTADVRGAVLRNVVVIAPIPEGVEWAPGHPVRLAIGFAGMGDDVHLRLLASVARVLSDERLVMRLKTAPGGMPAIETLFEQ